MSGYKINKLFLLTGFFIFLFITIRSVYLSNRFMFIYDQVYLSVNSLKMWQTKTISLIGTHASFAINNRHFYFGGAVYYIHLIFLLLAGFDPFWATYFFMIFCAFMIIPLYIGVKHFVNTESAIMIIIIYTLLPFFIDSTYSLNNPNYLLALIPVLLFLMVLFDKKQNMLIFFIMSVLQGILFQLHYFYLFSMIGILIYYFFNKKIDKKYIFVFLIGFCLGMINMIIFELRHNFYNIRTVLLFFQFSGKKSAIKFSDYYFISEIMLGLVLISFFIKKYINKLTNIILFIILLIIALPYVTVSAKNRNYPQNWYYRDDLRVYSIIKNNYSKISDFNIFEFYDAQGLTIKYFLKKDKININFEDYYNNKYLYVVYKNNNYYKDPAYEVASFQPAKIIKIWQINKTYKLYLLERIKT